MSDRMDDVLSSIDEALAGADEDLYVSGDAMRWAPPEESRELPKRIRWCPEVANPAVPTVAELDAGIDLTEQIAAVSFTYEPRRTITVRMSVDTRPYQEAARRLAAVLQGVSVEEAAENLRRLSERLFPTDPAEPPPTGEELRRRALEARRNRNTGPQRHDNRRWRNT